MNIDEVINGWTFEETIKTAKSLMEAEKNMFKWDVIRHLRDFVENYRGQLKEYQQLEEQGRIIKLPYNGNYSEKDDSALSKFVATMIYYESLNNRLTKIYGKCDGLLEQFVEALEDRSSSIVPKDTFKSVLLTNEDVDSYEECKQLEEQGRLIKLPCKVGARLYWIDDEDDYGHKEMCIKQYSESEKVTGFSIGEDGEILVFIGYDNSEPDIVGGRYALLTKSAAEAKLEELRGNNE